MPEKWDKLVGGLVVGVVDEPDQVRRTRVEGDPVAFDDSVVVGYEQCL